MTLEELNIMRPEYKGLLCLNQKQTAEIIGVSSSTLENWRKEGVGPEYKKIDNGKKGKILIPKTSLIEWLNNTVKTA
ncbi:MAG: helix-turn-helix domain-containing protein [Arcobacter sp.]|uniref:helix-turn-helix domain-containing protein n=1 Tax=Arcobacter sp. TaxID=1872629 RepID=UPI003C71000E